MKKQGASSTKALAQAIQELTLSFGIDKKLEQYEAVTQWAGIVGPQIAKETEPQKIERGLLLVRVRKGVWRNELTMRKEEIIAKLNKAIGNNAVKDIKFQ